jgi:alpha-L-fucosidase 2
MHQLPTYGTEPDPEQGGQTVIQKWSEGTLKEKGGVDRHGTLIQGVFPAGLINWFSSDEEKELAKRTINLVERTTNHANSNVTINIARARLGLGEEAIANSKLCFSGTTGKHSKEQPNGFFYWNAHGYYMTEQVAIARLVTELLLQSVSDVIRIFPAWPTSTDAHFTDLPAHGGFKVSASLVGGKITKVIIHSTVGGTVKLVSPWRQGFKVIEEGSKRKERVTTEPNGSVFATRAGKSYLLLPASEQ